MDPDIPEDIVTLLERLTGGQVSGHDVTQALYAAAYQELRRIAAARVAKSPHSTLRPTELVHEAFVRVMAGRPVKWQGRAHFLRYAARAMHNLLVERARRRGTVRHGGDRRRVSLDLVPGREDQIVDVLIFEDAFRGLSESNERLAQVIEMKVFAGASNVEVGHCLGISEATVRSDLMFARRVLAKELLASEGPS